MEKFILNINTVPNRSNTDSSKINQAGDQSHHCFAYGVISLHYDQANIKSKNMKQNMGSMDRILRIIVAAVFGILYFNGIVTGTPGILLLVLGGIFVLTSFVGHCPIYKIIGLNTCSGKTESK